eukprot:gene3101-3395_t
MYAGGDILAQHAEHYNSHKDSKDKEEIPPLELSYRRCLIFFLYGTFIGGPAYHYWFNYLNELPALLWRMKQSRQRGKILRAYALLKSHNIEVKLDLSKLPQTTPVSKWKGKAAKILADQLIFSSIYTLVFFLSIGMLSGAADRLALHYEVAETTTAGLESAYYHHSQHGDGNRNHPAAIAAAAAVNTDNDKLREVIEKLAEFLNEEVEEASTVEITRRSWNKHQQVVSPVSEEKQEQQLLQASEDDRHGCDVFLPSPSSLTRETQAYLLHDLIISLQTIQALRVNGLSWSEIWQRTWAHTKAVYWTTYLTDCAVWPPLQLVNFTFVPLRFQFLYVNVANLAWNTFLSLMANKNHGGVSHGVDDHAG